MIIDFYEHENGNSVLSLYLTRSMSVKLPRSISGGDGGLYGCAGTMGPNGSPITEGGRGHSALDMARFAASGNFFSRLFTSLEETAFVLHFHHLFFFFFNFLNF